MGLLPVWQAKKDPDESGPSQGVSLRAQKVTRWSPVGGSADPRKAIVAKHLHHPPGLPSHGLQHGGIIRVVCFHRDGVRQPLEEVVLSGLFYFGLGHLGVSALPSAPPRPPPGLFLGWLGRRTRRVTHDLRPVSGQCPGPIAFLAGLKPIAEAFY